MPRRPRIDSPGLLHHAMNRGIARRTVFETRADVRYFLALLAREARAGRLNVYAFAFLTTHYHLLVASPQGDISGVMRRVLNRYVRYFNRTRRRDGALFRGRFRSRPVTSMRYRFTLIRYIDQNAVQARLVSRSQLYPFGSASLYAARRRPRWLDTSWVDERMGNPKPEERAIRYGDVFGPPLRRAERDLVTARIRSPAALADSLDDLVKAAPPRVLRWMQRKALLADQTKPGLPHIDATSVLQQVALSEAGQDAWTCTPAKKRVSAWPVARVGLLRELAGLTHQQIASALQLPQTSAQVRARQHRKLMMTDSGYARRTAELAARCLGALANPWDLP